MIQKLTEKSKLQNDEDGITLRRVFLYSYQIIHFLFRKRVYIILFTIIGTMAGLSYAIFKHPVYTASISFVMDTGQNTSSALSSYESLAARLDLNVSGNGGNGLFSGDNIYDLMKTRLMLERTLLTPVTISGERILLIDRYIKINRLRNKWKNDAHYKNISFNDTSKFTIYQNAIVASICEQIANKNLTFSDKSLKNTSSIMGATFTSKDEQFSFLFLNNLIKNVAQFYVDTKTETARAVLNVVSKQLDSVRSELYEAMSNVALFQDRNLNLIRLSPRTQQQKSSLKMDITSTIYQQLISAAETAKLNLQKETPLFKIIDKPILPLSRRQPNKFIWALIGAFLGFCLSSGCLLIHRFFKEVMSEDIT